MSKIKVSISLIFNKKPTYSASTVIKVLTRFLVLCLISLNLDAHNVVKADEYPNVPERIVEFFDATIFMNPDNKLEYLPEYEDRRGSKRLKRTYMEFAGTIVPNSSGYLDDYIMSLYAINALRGINRSNNNEIIKHLSLYGVMDESDEELLASYNHYSEFMEGNPEYTFSDYKKVMIQNGCFVQREFTNQGRKIFSSVFYNQTDKEGPSYKRKLATCFSGAILAYKGVWPLPYSAMDVLVKQSYGKSPDDADAEFIYNDLNSMFDSPFYLDRTSIDLFGGRILKVGMGRAEFLSAYEKLYKYIYENLKR